MSLKPYIFVAGVFAAGLVSAADLRRRRLSLTRSTGWHWLTGLDIASSSVTLAIAAGLLLLLIPTVISQAAVPLWLPATWGIVASTAIFVFLWSEGRRQIQFQRPHGIVVAEWLILASVSAIVMFAAFSRSHGLTGGATFYSISIIALLGGSLLLLKIVPPFVRKGSEYHRILDRLDEQGESIQREYTPPTPECPNPELWSMVDSQTTELEVLEFLKSLVVALKPHLIVETGTFLGYGTIKMAEGLRANGFGKLITIEYDPVIYAKARERIEAAGLGDWVESRNESSLETRINGTIDLLFSDSALAVREPEIRRLLPQVDPRGLIAIHDASSHFGVVRDLASRMEQEGLLSVVMLSTPRGLVLAQRREGRK